METEVSADEARAALAADKKRRAEECGKAVDKLLGEYRCKLMGKAVLGHNVAPQFVFQVEAQD